MAIEPIQIQIGAQDDASAVIEQLRTGLGALEKSIREETEAQKAAIDVERQQVDVLRQEALLEEARAKATGDDAAASNAHTRQLQAEARASELDAMAKRAEATAIERTALARHEARAAAGPLTQSLMRELQLSQQKAMALRTEAQALDTSAARSRLMATQAGAAAASTDKLAGIAEKASETLHHVGLQMGAAFSAEKFVEANIEMEGLRRSFAAVFGGAKQGAQELDFVREAAQRLGASAMELSEGYLRLAASTRGTALEGKATRDVFVAVTQAMGVLGRSSFDTQRALAAIGQMASTGKVNMTELRRELAVDMPGALEAVSRGMGVTVAQLEQLSESGRLLAADVLPALTKGLQETNAKAAPPQGMAAEWGRLKNAMEQAFVTIGDTGVWDVVKVSLRILGGLVGGLAYAFSLLADTFMTTVRIISTGVNALIHRDFKGLRAATGQLTDDMIGRQVKLGESLTAMVFGADQAAAAHQDVAHAAQQSAQASQGSAVAAQAAGNAHAQAATQVQANAEAHQAGAAAVSANASAQAAVVTGVQNAAAAAAAANPTWGNLSLAYEQAQKNAEQAAAVKEKLAKATELAGRAAMENAKLSGNEREALQVAASAAEHHVAALQAVAEARRNGLSEMQKYRDLLVAEAAKLGDVGGARAKEITEIDKTIAMRRAETEQAQQAVEAAKAETAARTLARQSYEDNSASLGLLRQAMEGSRQALDGYILAQKDGYATQEQVNEARQRAAMVEGLYNDALRDTQKAIERSAVAIRNKNQITQAGLEVQMQEARNDEAAAQAMGNMSAALEAQVRQREIHIRSVQANAEAMRNEAQQAIDGSEKVRRELVDSNQLTVEKDAEIQARIANAKAKLLEANGSTEVVKGLQREIDAMRLHSALQGNGGGSGGSGGVGVGGSGAGGGGARGTTGLIDSRGNYDPVVAERPQTLTDWRIQNPNAHDYGEGRPDPRPGTDGSTYADQFGVERRRSDGAPVGTFTNTTPMDKAFAVQQEHRTGNPVSLDEALAGLQQASHANGWLHAFSTAGGGVEPGVLAQMSTLLRANEDAVAKARHREALQQATKRVQIDFTQADQHHGTAYADDERNANGIQEWVREMQAAKAVARR